MNRLFRVAVLQQKSLLGDCDVNVKCILAQMKRAAILHADILLLPECFITGYAFPIEQDRILNDDSVHIQQLCDAARELHIGVVATAFTKGKNKPQNSAFVIDKAGHILLKYSKVHTCDFADEACLESGEEFKVCDFDGVKIGVMICYDREYPESARVLMMKGAEIILVPNDCTAMRPRVQALSTRAYENMVGIAMANPPGEDAGRSCAYAAMCWDKDGKCIDNTLLLADEESEKIFIAEFDLKALRDYRAHEMMGNTFRKVKAYAPLMDAEIQEPFVRG